MRGLPYLIATFAPSGPIVEEAKTKSEARAIAARLKTEHERKYLRRWERDPD